MDIEEYARRHPQFYEYSVPAILRQSIAAHSPVKILDCGCGDGALLVALWREGLLRGAAFIGVDLSATRIDRIRHALGDLADFHVESAETLTCIPDSSVDLFVSTQVIEHVDDRKFLAAASRVLKPGGHAYITTVHKKRFAWYFYKNSDGVRSLDPTHLREYEADHQLFSLPEFDSFDVIRNEKHIFKYPIATPILRRMRPRDNARSRSRRSVFRIISKARIPIVGYYNW